MSVGVGIIGAGPVTQAIHVPTLGRLRDRFRIAHIMDVDAGVAQSVAQRADCSWSTSLDALLDDAAVDAVAICSPPAHHAQQIESAVRAGISAILCEKPLALSADEAEHLVAVVADSSTSLIVGTMHRYDPGWQKAEREWGDLPADVRVVRSSIVLPRNDRFIDLATEMVVSSSPMMTQRATGEASRVERYRSAILGLAIHDLPLVREFLPTVDNIIHPEALEPFGYAVGLAGGAARAELIGHMHDHWRSEWTFEVWAADRHLRVEFPPSYVHAGSSTAFLTTSAETRQYGPYTSNGYEQEWRELFDLVTGQREQSRAELDRVVEDLRYAARIASTPPVPRDVRRTAQESA